MIMENRELHLKTGSLISNTTYNRALELFEIWDEYIDEQCAENEDFNRTDWYEDDGTPSIDKIVECVGNEFMWPKMHQYPEDVIGIDCSEEVEECYDLMSDEEIREFVDEGIKRFEKEKRL